MNSQQSIIQVFVYGTLKPGESNYETYCQGKTIAEIPAYTRGQLYQLLPGYPAITTGNNKARKCSINYCSIIYDHSLNCNINSS